MGHVSFGGFSIVPNTLDSVALSICCEVGVIGIEVNESKKFCPRLILGFSGLKESFVG